MLVFQSSWTYFDGSGSSPSSVYEFLDLDWVYCISLVNYFRLMIIEPSACVAHHFGSCALTSNKAFCVHISCRNLVCLLSIELFSPPTQPTNSHTMGRDCTGSFSTWALHLVTHKVPQSTPLIRVASCLCSQGCLFFSNPHQVHKC